MEGEERKQAVAQPKEGGKGYYSMENVCPCIVELKNAYAHLDSRVPS